MSEPRTNDLGSAPTRALLAVLAWAALTGAAGVALAAVAAHKVDSPALATAAQMLMIHATAAVAILAVAGRAALGRAGVVLAVVMLAAVNLFSGDVSVHAITGKHLFPMAAPTGGSLLIASWLALAIMAIARWVRASKAL